MYPKEVCVIPATVIEEFEKSVLQSNVKLVFNKNKREFKGTAWVGQYAIYDPDKLRDFVDNYPVDEQKPIPFPPSFRTDNKRGEEDSD